MKYITEILIAKPIEEVTELFDSYENRKHWQPELLSYELLDGNLGKQGAKSKLKFKMGKREMEMIETIHRRNLPEVFDAVYEANGVLNLQFNKFEKESEKETRWISENEFRFKGMMKYMSWLMPGAFKKQSMKYMKQFKAFAEEN